MKNKKTSWEYQKNGNYKQLKIMFNLNSEYDAALHHFLVCHIKNKSMFIKDLIYKELMEWSNEE